MRTIRTAQASIFELFAAHDIGRELQAMSVWLDEHREVLEWVAADLRWHGLKPTGREGLPVESVLRCALLKQHRQLSYEELAFHLLDLGQAFKPSRGCRCIGCRRSRRCSARWRQLPRRPGNA